MNNPHLEQTGRKATETPDAPEKSIIEAAPLRGQDTPTGAQATAELLKIQRDYEAALARIAELERQNAELERMVEGLPLSQVPVVPVAFIPDGVPDGVEPDVLVHCRDGVLRADETGGEVFAYRRVIPFGNDSGYGMDAMLSRVTAGAQAALAGRTADRKTTPLGHLPHFSVYNELNVMVWIEKKSPPPKK